MASAADASMGVAAGVEVGPAAEQPHRGVASSAERVGDDVTSVHILPASNSVPGQGGSEADLLAVAATIVDDGAKCALLRSASQLLCLRPRARFDRNCDDVCYIRACVQAVQQHLRSMQEYREARDARRRAWGALSWVDIRGMARVALDDALAAWRVPTIHEAVRHTPIDHLSAELCSAATRSAWLRIVAAARCGPGPTTGSSDASTSDTSRTREALLRYFASNPRLQRAASRLLRLGAYALTHPADSLPPTCSSWAGLPAVGPGYPWPRAADGTPAEFLAQINFGEVRAQITDAISDELLLPSEGLLQLFVDDGEEGRIGPPTARLVPTTAFPSLARDFPFSTTAGAHQYFRHGNAVKAVAFHGLPSQRTEPVAWVDEEGAQLSEEEIWEIVEIGEEFSYHNGLQLRGYGRYYNGCKAPHMLLGTSPTHEQYGSLAPWTLLLMVPWSEGDVYVWIPEPDLAAGRFDRLVVNYDGS